MAATKHLFTRLSSLLSELFAAGLPGYRDGAADNEFFEIFHRTQNLVDAETLNCLLLLSKPYSEVFMCATRRETGKGKLLLEKANKMKEKFAFNPMEADIFKVLTYPKISYLHYKLNNIANAKSYTSKLISILQRRRVLDFLFEFSLYQQRINYAKLCFQSDELMKGLDITMVNIIELVEMDHRLKSGDTATLKYNTEDRVVFIKIVQHNIRTSLMNVYKVLSSRPAAFDGHRKIDNDQLQQVIDAAFWVTGKAGTLNSSVYE